MKGDKIVVEFKAEDFDESNDSLARTPKNYPKHTDCPLARALKRKFPDRASNVHVGARILAGEI